MYLDLNQPHTVVCTRVNQGASYQTKYVSE